MATTNANTLPLPLADALVARHDECCTAPDHHMPGISRNNFTLIGQQLGKILGFPVLSEDLPDGWKFNGAALCHVGPTNSAHLLFHRGEEFVSVFSLPEGFIKTAVPSGGEVSQMADHHPLAGFATSNGFYCIVGSSADGSLSLSAIQALRDQLKPDMSKSASAQTGRLTIAAR